MTCFACTRPQAVRLQRTGWAYQVPRSLTSPPPDKPRPRGFLLTVIGSQIIQNNARLGKLGTRPTGTYRMPLPCNQLICKFDIEEGRGKGTRDGDGGSGYLQG